MKGDSNMIATLNSLLVHELSAVNQYIAHSEMYVDYGYGSLREHFEKRAVDEVKHAEKLFSRIISLEGTPLVTELKELQLSSQLPEQLDNDHAAELRMIKAYNAAIRLAGKTNDFATREILRKNLNDELRHLDTIKELSEYIAHTTLPDYFAAQVG